MKTFPESSREQNDYDRTSEPFTKPIMCPSVFNKLKSVAGSLGSLPQKRNVTLDTEKNITMELLTEMNRATIKAFGKSQIGILTDDLSLEESKKFVVQWSVELRILRKKCGSYVRKISNVEKFKRCLDCHFKENQTQILTEFQKDFLWFVRLLKSLPKSLVCQEEASKTALVNLYRQWKKGMLVSILPILNFIMKSILYKLSNFNVTLLAPK